MPVDFKKNNADDLGTDVAAAIQPVLNGEPVNQAIFQRPSENLRQRTEELKRVATESELVENQARSSFISSQDGACALVSTTYDAPALDGSEPVAGYSIPPVTSGYQFTQKDAATPLVVGSPSIPGSKAIFHKAKLDTLYSESTQWGDEGIANNGAREHALLKRGDSLALIFPTKGTLIPDGGPEDLDALDWYPDGDVDGYTQLTGGQAGIAENNIVKLPQRVILRDSTGALDLATTYGPGQADVAKKLFLAPDANGFAAVDTVARPQGVWLNISAVTGGTAYTWYLNGGRGGRRENGPGVNDGRDYLRVAGATADSVEVYSTNPFRVIWPSTQAKLKWNFYTRSATNFPEAYADYLAQFTAVAAAEFQNGSTQAKDFSKHALVPIVTYTDDGFDFGSAGYLPDNPSRTGTTSATAGFVLPIDYGTELARQGTIAAANVEEGSLLVGCKARQSAGLTMAASSLSVQLDAIVASLGGGYESALAAATTLGTDGKTEDPLYINTDLVAAGAVSTLVVPLESTLPVNAGGKNVRVIAAWIDLITLWDIADLTVSFGTEGSAVTFLPAIQINTTFGIVGRHSMSADFGAYLAANLTGKTPRLTFTSAAGTLFETIGAGRLRVVLSYTYY